MALPKLNTVEYFCKLPVSGIEAKYRPFTVGEQKGLLQALEDGENRTIANTVINLVEGCSSLVESHDSVRHLSNTDLEYLFMQIRIKSVGEETTVQLGCKNQPNCDGITPVKIDLNSIEIEGEVKDNKVMLTDTIGVTLKVPNFNEVQGIVENVESISTSDIFNILSKSIDSIFTEDEVHSRGDFTEKELDDFMNELSTEQFNVVMEWFNGLPKLVKDVEYECSKCGTHCEVRLEGIQNFFV